MLELDPADLRAHRALDRHYAARERWRDLEELLGTRGQLRVRRRGPRARLPPRRAARHPSRRRRRRARPARVRSSSPCPATRARGGCSRSCSTVPDHRQRVARILEPLYESSGAWARLVASSKCSARRWRAARPRRCWRASPICRRTSCRRARRRWPPGGRCWPPIRATRDALTEIERLATRSSASPSWSTSIRSWPSTATPPTSRARRSAVAGGASSTAGAWATGAPPSTPGSWS